MRGKWMEPKVKVGELVAFGMTVAFLMVLGAILYNGIVPAYQ